MVQTSQYVEIIKVSQEAVDSEEGLKQDSDLLDDDLQTGKIRKVKIGYEIVLKIMKIN